MTSPQLPNYLLSNRKRLALSQDEVAFLLGAESGENVCRHERFLREPTLATALAYEVIFKRSASELFGGLYQRIEGEIIARAKILYGKAGGRKLNQRTTHKHRMLSDLAGIRLQK